LKAMNISGQVVLVTGGSSGLGAACAEALHAAGAHVAIADLDAARGRALAATLGDRACFAETDVTDEASVVTCLRVCGERLGAIRAVINCAGVAPGERVLRKDGPHSLENFRHAIDINLIGTFNVLRLAAEAMSKLPPLPSGERGVIINTSSVAAFEGQLGQAAYAASKAGINGMTLPIARELAKFGIRVMTIAPGIFETPLMQAMTPELRGSLAQQIPFPARFGRPPEFAALVRHIIENEYLNGEIIRLDGAVRMGTR
jgi:NAD(P)-dependent dehydrogenase (short-subunit alcohol dehydrogenase family)